MTVRVAEPPPGEAAGIDFGQLLAEQVERAIARTVAPIAG